MSMHRGVTMADKVERDVLREQVRDHYAAAARAVHEHGEPRGCGAGRGCGGGRGQAGRRGGGAGASWWGGAGLGAVRRRGAARGCGGDRERAGRRGGGAEASCCEEGALGAVLYRGEDRAGLPTEAVAASLGCGNPTAVADLHEGEVVLDLGSGGGIDV